jgi:hypothetical protein
MFISKLSSIIEEYDRYGEHRINGVKAVFVLFMLFLVNMVYTIPNPYFNYFYVPMTAISAEVIGDSVKNKYLMFFYTSIGATISAFLFNITIIYPLFFLFFVFFYSLGLYLIAINFMKNLLVPVPIILSLAIYSLLYGEVSTDFYIALNNSLVSLLAIVVIMASLLFFPLSYYFRAWLRAFVLMLKQILGNFEMIRDNEEIKIELVQPHLIMMVRFARLLPRKLPIFNILKINLLMNDLRLLSSIPKHQTNTEIEDTIIGIRRLIEAVEKNEACPAYVSNPNFLNKIINTWNGICYRI